LTVIVKDVIAFQKQKQLEHEKTHFARAAEAGCVNTKSYAALAEFQKVVALLYDEFGKEYKDLIAKIRLTKTNSSFVIFLFSYSSVCIYCFYSFLCNNAHSFFVNQSYIA
jgi:hypothetical protein